MDLQTGYNLIDIFIIGTILIGFILGIWKGFVRSLTALASLVFGVLLALKYYPLVEPYLGMIGKLNPHISMVIAMVIVFIIVQIAFILIRWLLAALVDLTSLSWLDRVLGAIMGVAAALVVVAVAVHVLWVGLPEWPAVKKSKFVGPVRELTAKLVPMVPKSTRDHIESMVNRWKKGQGSGAPAKPSTPDKSKPPVTPRPGTKSGSSAQAPCSLRIAIPSV